MGELSHSISRTALITGVAGQDGSYLAEQLIAQGYRVVGVVHNKVAARERLPKNVAKAVELVHWEVRDEAGIIEVLKRYEPREIYNFAAYASGTRMHQDPVSMG